MATRTKTPFLLSNMPIPPGEILEEELEARDMTRQALATRMAENPRTIDAIISGEKAIGSETAVELANALGIGAHYWLGLQADYVAALAQNGTTAASRAAARNQV